MREYALIVMDMPEYVRIMSVSDTVQRIRSLCKLMRSYQDRGVWRTLATV